MYQFIIFLHITAAMGFMIGHGASAGIAFRLPKEHHLERIRALLDVSGTLFALTYLSLLLQLITGIVGGILGRWWNQGWIWTSLGLLIALSVYMAIVSRNHYHKLRKVVGLPFFEGSKESEAQEPASQEEIEAVLAEGKPMQLMIIGFGGFALILFLMMYKPF